MLFFYVKLLVCQHVWRCLCSTGDQLVGCCLLLVANHSPSKVGGVQPRMTQRNCTMLSTCCRLDFEVFFLEGCFRNEQPHFLEACFRNEQPHTCVASLLDTVQVFSLVTSQQATIDIL